MHVFQRWIRNWLKGHLSSVFDRFSVKSASFRYLTIPLTLPRFARSLFLEDSRHISARRLFKHLKGLLVNVTVEDLAPCKKLVRFELEPKAVDEAFETDGKGFRQEVRCPASAPAKLLRTWC